MLATSVGKPFLLRRNGHQMIKLFALQTQRICICPSMDILSELIVQPQIDNDKSNSHEDEMEENNANWDGFELMAVPKQRRSTGIRKRRQKQNWANRKSVAPIKYRECDKCGAPVMHHHICMQCFRAPSKHRPMNW